ncbi:hypothetical protein BDZ89DRAFT_956621 [Hymenopellis radicata]|nr:hypothetical protein BDZ89DRAFT_956621 [Hymenopellis radicata]
MPAITSFFGRTGDKAAAGTSASKKVNTKLVPCSGIGPADSVAVETYLDRTGALGGGATSVTKLAQKMYRKAFSLLPTTRKQQVKRAQRHEWKWTNDHSSGRIYSTSCSKQVDVAIPAGKSGKPKPEPTGQCSACKSLLGLKRFKTAIARPRPPNEHYKYIPFEHRASGSIASAYARCKGLQTILEHDVSTFVST